MSDMYEGNFITMVDEDGEEFELEILDSLDWNGQTYTAFLPADMDESDPDYGLVLLRAGLDENGEEVYDTIDDEEELDAVYEQFMKILFADEEEEEE